MTPCYIFDIDGTIADLSHRLHHIEKSPPDWDAFFAACAQDVPIMHIHRLLMDLSSAGAVIVYVSGRSDQVRDDTIDWMSAHGFPFGDVFMRKQGDHRPDNLVKADLIDELLQAGYQPIMVFDDRDQVVKMWREKGVPCAQVAEGNF